MEHQIKFLMTRGEGLIIHYIHGSVGFATGYLIQTLHMQVLVTDNVRVP